LADEGWKPRVNPWAIAATVALAAFMEVLDTSIANVALPYIAGGLAASEDQAEWVLTTYLVSNAIVLPMGGWAAEVMGRKNFFLLCIVIFTVASLMCGLAPSLPLLLAFRVLQGAGGGGLQPMAQAIMADSFEPSKRGLAFSLYGIVAVLAPSIGPTLGGWITFNYSWKWIFFINLPVGILAFLLTQRLVDDPPWIKPDIANLRKLDVPGFLLLATSMGSLEVTMDKGEEWDWFGSTKIRWFFGIFVVAFVSLIITEWRTKRPLMQLRLYTYKNFAVCSFLMLLTGGVLNASTVLQPQLLQSLFGYTPTLAGLTLSGGGIALLFVMPMAGQALGRFPARNLIAFGFLTFALGYWWSAYNLNLGVDFKFLSYMRVAQIFGLPFVFISLTTAAYFNLPQQLNNQVSGLMNFSRNLGGSVLISLSNAFVTESNQFHRTNMLKHIATAGSNYQQNIQNYSDQVQRYVGPANAQSGAMQRIYTMLGNQVGILSYVDVYYLLGYMSLLLFCLTFVLDRNQPSRGGGGHAME
jgi:DHA2 family multidrug resistance protein